MKEKFSFIRLFRLHRAKDFRRVFRGGDKIRLDRLIVYARLNGLGYARLGLVVSKKVAPNATLRNRLKRVIRESFRLNRRALPDCDIIVIITYQFFTKDRCLLFDLNKQWLNLADYYKKV